MLYLMIAPPGAGKSHWLLSQRADIHVDCSLLSHRAILLSIAEQAGILNIPRRATIADILSLTTTAVAGKTIGMDNIDRAPHKLNFSLLQLTKTATIYATATERRRIKPILDRGAAILVPPPTPDINAILAERYPELSPAQRRQIASQAASPASAIAMAEAAQRGTQLPAPPTSSILPIALISILAITYLIRRDAELPGAWIAIIAAAGYALRRYFWKST